MEKKIIFLIIWVKLCTFFIIFLSFNLLPFAKNYYYANFIYPPNEKISLQSAFKTWDAQHYLFLSEQGYKRGQISNAFSPLFPILVNFLTKIFNNSFISGLIISNLMSFLALFYFYKLVRMIYSEKIAYQSLIFLLAFPTSFYFSLIYTESLFFLLVVLFFFFLYKKQFFYASFFALLMPLARQIGILIFFPFLTYYLFEEKKLKFSSQLSVVSKACFNKKTFLILTPILGFGLYFLYIFYATGNALEMFSAMNFFVSKHSVFYIFNPSLLFNIIFNANLALHGFINSILDRVFFILFLFLLFLIYKKTNITFFIYSLLMGFVFILSGTFMSYTRHLLVVFPIFIALGIIFQEQKYSFLKLPLIYFMIMLQTLFLIMHALNYWVA